MTARIKEATDSKGNRFVHGIEELIDSPWKLLVAGKAQAGGVSSNAIFSGQSAYLVIARGCLPRYLSTLLRPSVARQPRQVRGNQGQCHRPVLVASSVQCLDLGCIPWGRKVILVLVFSRPQISPKPSYNLVYDLWNYCTHRLHLKLAADQNFRHLASCIVSWTSNSSGSCSSSKQ